jgi:deoxyribose-phosphate aldolase
MALQQYTTHELQQYAARALVLIDLTSLNYNDSNKTIINLCNTKSGTLEMVPVATVCIFSHFIQTARTELARTNSSYIKIATVTNFPHGLPDLELAIYETELAIRRGADEVDIVFPYSALINGDAAIGYEMVKYAKQICGGKILKVIIESGELKTSELIRTASEISIDAGADFIKTSTGKVAINATLLASEIMLKAIKKSGKKCGFKASGGIRTVAEAIPYLDLAANLMGDGWILPSNFRFGASSLLADVLNLLNTDDSNHNTKY